MKTHRVGTVTLGITLVSIGIFFLLGLFISTPIYTIVFKGWPIIFIILGVEILVGNAKKEQIEFVYDKVAIWLTVTLTLFAMFLAVFSQAALLYMNCLNVRCRMSVLYIFFLFLLDNLWTILYSALN